MTINASTVQPKKNIFYQFSLGFLTISSWISGIIFAGYIFGFYITAHTLGAEKAWNNVLPGLYSPDKPLAITGMISHFFFGSLLLIMGPIQFSERIRKNFTNFHRWTGLLYTLAAFMTGFGGLLFLAVWGAAGGTPMLIGFTIYGLLMMICPIQTIRYALIGQYKTHREWAIRLFALVLGSWIYRIGYGVLMTLLDRKGLGPQFSGPADYFMDFAFFVIPLIIAEIVIKGKNSSAESFWKFAGAALCIITSLLIWQATFFFLDSGNWGKSILVLLQR